MKRVSIVSTCSGNGKTTLGKQLASILEVPFVELDALVHGPNWTETPDDELVRILEPILAGDGWVIDGNYSSKFGNLVLEQADTVVWLDLPIRVWLPRLIRRTARRIVRREELWNGNRETLKDAIGGKDALIPFAFRMHSAEAPDLSRPAGRVPDRAAPDARRRSMRSSAPPAGLELRHPGGDAKSDPDRRQDHVERHHGDGEAEEPHRPVTERHPALVVDRPALGPPEALAAAHVSRRSRWRSATSLITRIAVSSTEKSETSSTGQPRRRWIAVAWSSSS